MVFKNLICTGKRFLCLMKPKIEGHVTINAHNPQKNETKSGKMGLSLSLDCRKKGALRHGKCTSSTSKKQQQQQQRQRQCNNEIAYQLASNLRQWAAATTDWLCSTSSFNPIRKTHVSASMLICISNGCVCAEITDSIGFKNISSWTLWHSAEVFGAMWNNHFSMGFSLVHW